MKKRIETGNIKCPECSEKCKPTRIDVEGFDVEGWRCNKCGHEVISPDNVEKAYLLLKARGREKVKISKRGHSYMISIPRAIAKAIGIENLTTAEIFLKDRKTITVKV